MRKLLESIDKFAGEPEQKRGDQVRGTDNPKKSGKKHGFHGRLVGEDMDSFTQELLNEYHRFVSVTEADPPDNTVSPVANINPPGQGIAQANANVATANTSVTNQPAQIPNPPGVNPPAPGQQQPAPNQQPNPAQVAAAAKQQQDLKNNIDSLKTIDPTINTQKMQTALAKDPKKATPMDAQQLGQLSNTLEPILTNKQAFSNLKGKIQQMLPKK